MATISLVTIVRNEAGILRRMLESVRGIVDEFVIVDTGSTDGTQDIAREYGAVIELPFVDFVVTKNAALEKATGDYVLFMDADEYVVEGLEKLKAYAEQGVECVSARIVEGSETETACTYYRDRLWRNDGRWRFAGPGCHEVIAGPGPVVFDAGVRVMHDHRHRAPESYGPRNDLYLRLLSEALARDPSDARAQFYLARTYKDAGAPLRAIAEYERYLGLGTDFIDERWQAAYDIAACWKTQGEYDRALEACGEALRIDNRRAEAWNLAGDCHFAMQAWATATKCYEVALDYAFPEDVVLFIDPRQYGPYPADQLAVCYDRLKRYDLSLAMTERLAAALGPKDARVRGNLAWLHGRAHKTFFFTLGHTPEPVYGGMIDEVGVGGVETTYLELPRELAALGHRVFVFCRCETEHTREGVSFVPYTDLDGWLDMNPDVVVTSRWFEPLYKLPKAHKVIWLQDAHFADPDHPDAWQVADTVVCSSNWHRQYIAERLGHGLAAEKIHVVPLAIRKAFFEGSVERDPLKVIYSSNPDRGLYVLADMWPAIRERVPGVHLTVTYGWEGLRTWSDSPEWQAQVDADERRLREWASGAGDVRVTGRLRKADLAREMMSSALCLYPNNFWETFCLTALETQAAGTPMVTTRLGALDTTLDHEHNVLITGDPYSPSYRERFIEAAVALLADHERREAMSRGCREHALGGPTDWSDVARQWQSLIWERS